MEYYAGLDLHKSMSVIVVKDKEGVLLKRGKVNNEPYALKEFFSDFDANNVQVVMEATTNYSWMYDQLEAMGHGVVLAHPLKVKAIASAKVKTDKIDAGVLSDLLRANLVPTSYVPPPAIRALREIIRHRIRMVKTRTQSKHAISAMLSKLNLSTGQTDTFGKKGRLFLKNLNLDESFKIQLEDQLAQIDFVSERIKSMDRLLALKAKEVPEVVRLVKIPGIGIFSALLILAEIGDIHRFDSPKKLASYSGLVPGVYQSASTRHARGITRQGSRYLRWILVEASQQIIRHPGPLREFYFRLLKGKGHGKALVAVARKMLVGIYFVLKENKEFCPN